MIDQGAMISHGCDFWNTGVIYYALLNIFNSRGVDYWLCWNCKCFSRVGVW